MQPSSVPDLVEVISALGDNGSDVLPEAAVVPQISLEAGPRKPQTNVRSTQILHHGQLPGTGEQGPHHLAGQVK